MVRKIIYMALVLFCVSACHMDVEEAQFNQSDISLTIKGDLVMSFNENNCQLGYNTERNEFRVYDEKLENWFIVRCSTGPTSEGQKIKVNLEYTTSKVTKTLNDLDCSVEQISSDGLVWIWNKDKQIGIIIKQL